VEQPGAEAVVRPQCAAKIGQVPTPSARVRGGGKALVPAEPAIVSQITVFPNPIVDTFTIQYTSPVDQSAQVSIFEQSGGTLIMQTMVMANTGVNNIVLGTTNIYNGTYILVFTPMVSGGAATTRIVIYR